LEIFADDVACGHGATVAEINRDHLFYLMARGVPEADARALLVKAFVAELVDEIEDEALHDALHDRLSAWLATH
jgi:Fe-S cluster assembly protein SufD